MVTLTLGPVPTPLQPTDPVNKAYVDSGAAANALMWFLKNKQSGISAGSADAYIWYALNGSSTPLLGNATPSADSFVSTCGGRAPFAYRVKHAGWVVQNRSSNIIGAQTLNTYWRVFNVAANSVRINQSSNWSIGLASRETKTTWNRWANIPADIEIGELAVLGIKRNLSTAADFQPWIDVEITSPTRENMLP